MAEGIMSEIKEFGVKYQGLDKNTRVWSKIPGFGVKYQGLE